MIPQQHPDGIDAIRAEWQAKSDQRGNGKGKVPNLWNDEQLKGRTPGHGAINIGIKVMGRWNIKLLKKGS